MARQVALLRGINVAGSTRIGMSELRKVFTDLGHSEVETYLQSGNVAFQATGGDSGEVADELERQIAATFGFEVSVLLRSRADFAKVIAANPYLGSEGDDTKLHVTFLAHKPSPEKLSSLQIPAGETGRFTVIGREVYLHCPDGYGRTKLNNSFIERRLGMRATTRNWKSVNALFEMVSN